MKDILIRCETCARDGHGPRHRECRDHWKELKEFKVRCWRPVGTILVWDNLEESGWIRHWREWKGK